MVQPTVIDAKAHLLGRLASVVAKQLLNGKHITVVRCESLCISGSFFRNKLKFSAAMNRKHLVNPKKCGPFHFRAPSRIFYKAVRGMIPHKGARGAAALQRLKCYEGVPPPLDVQKRMVVPAALRVLRLKPGRKYCVVGRISHEFGWQHSDVVKRLEEKRIIKATAYHQRKTATIKRKNAAIESSASQTAAIDAKLSAFGY